MKNKTRSRSKTPVRSMQACSRLGSRVLKAASGGGRQRTAVQYRSDRVTRLSTRSASSSSSQCSGEGDTDAAMTAANAGNRVFDADALSFLDEVHSIMKDHMVEGEKRDNKVVEFVQPEELKERLGLTVRDEGMDKKSLLELCKKSAQYSVRTGHPYFYNQLYQGKSAVGVAGAWLTDALNTNVHTFEVAPVFVLIENYVLESLCRLVGFPDGDGTFTPGGSFGNLMGVHLARYRSDKRVKQEGLFSGPRQAIFTSEGSHYSIWKAAHFLGFGTDNVFPVKTDDRGKMCPEDLDTKIQECKKQGIVPLMCNATTGTTVLGAFDPLDKLADVCQKHGVWLHVDAAWGGAALFSTTHRPLFKGVERADSVLWSLHKQIGVPLQAAVILVKHKGLLQECNGLKATYLFQQDKIYDPSYDIGDRTIQCGKHVDAFKFWLMWKASGSKGFEAHIDNLYDCAKYLAKGVNTRDGFRSVLSEFECTNVCFWYIPPRLRGQEETEDWWQQVGKVAPKIKAAMVKEGSMLIGHQPLAEKGLVDFFRVVLANPLSTREDMDHMLDKIDELGNDL